MFRGSGVQRHKPAGRFHQVPEYRPNFHCVKMILPRKNCPVLEVLEEVPAAENNALSAIVVILPSAAGNQTQE
jgi:hypothetical protein